MFNPANQSVNDATAAWQRTNAAQQPKPHPPPKTERSTAQEVGNAASQTGRVFGGALQGVNKVFAAPGIAIESLPQGAKDFIHWNGGQLSKSGPDKAFPSPAVDKPVTEAARAIDRGIQSITDSWVAPPTSPAAEFIAKASDAFGEAVPGMAAAIATGGLSASTVLAGNAASYAVGSANAFSTEMIEGSGDVGRAALAGAVEFGAEALGGKLVNAATAKITNPIASWGIDSVGEGFEEVLSGATQGFLIGESYSVPQAAEDFALGAVVGAVASGGISGVNAVRNEIGTAKTVHDIKAGKGGGALEGLTQSVSLAQTNPEQYGSVAQALATPAQETLFDTARFGTYVESAVKASGDSPIRVPSNIDKISARNVGGYETLTPTGMARAASVLEAAQVGKGLSPRQSGNILRAVVETNSNLYTQLGQAGSQNAPMVQVVDIERGAEYRNTLPETGATNNYSVMDVTGRSAQATEADRGVNVFRGMSSEWVIPTIEAGEFVVPNPTAPIEAGRTALFGSAPGQMLGAGLYLTSIPSKADQYTSGVANEISLQGRDSSGIMENSVLIGGTTYINESALSAAEGGIQNDIVRMGHVGDEVALKEFVNDSSENPDAAAIYSKMGDDYTEIVRPDASKTQIDRLYIPLRATVQESAATQAVGDSGQGMANAVELGRMRAESAAMESTNMTGNAEINTLLDQNISEPIASESVAADALKESVPNDKSDDTTKDITSGVASVALNPVAESISDSWNDAAEGRSSSTAQRASEGESISEVAKRPASSSSESVPAVSIPSENVPVATAPPAITETVPPSSPPIERTPPEIQSPPTEQNLPTGQSLGEPPKTPTTETPEERASSIWTPVQYMETTTMVQNRLKDDKMPKYSFDLVRGQGSTGQVHETSGYSATFGGLSSF